MTDQNLHPKLSEYFQALKEHTPQRDPDAAAKGRADFLSEVKDRQAQKSTPWFTEMIEVISALQIQVNRRLVTTIASVLIAIALTFGAVGGTVYASQNSLPNQPLYGIKIFSEDMRLRLTNQTEGKIDLLVTFTNRRVKELSELHNRGEEIPQRTISRLEQQTETMLALAAEQGETQASQSLHQIRNALQTHEALLTKLAQKEQGNAVVVLSRIQEKLSQKIKLAEEGLENPASFRKKMKRPRPSPAKPGKPEDAGTPEGKGKPDDVGTPKGNGKPEKAGTPQGKGKPEEPGPPEDKGKP